MMKADVIFYAASGTVSLLILVGILVWIWPKAAREDASRGRGRVAGQLMNLKSQSIIELREGLEDQDYRQLEQGIARLRKVNEAANWYLSEKQYGDQGDVFRQVLDQFSQNVGGRDLSSARNSFVQLTASCVACHRLAGNVPLDDDLPRSGKTPE
jgi:cytochrome c553